MVKSERFVNTIDGKKVEGSIAFLSPRGIGVSIVDPFKYTCGQSITKKQMAQMPLAERVNGEYTTTATGEQLAFRLHAILYKEACFLVENKQQVQSMIQAVITRKESYSERLQKEFFTTINHIEMDLEFLDMFSRLFLGIDYNLLGLFHPSFNREQTSLIRGDVISGISRDRHIYGRISVLTKMAVGVSICFPVECSAIEYSKEGLFARKDGKTWAASESGASAAKGLLIRLQEQADYLLGHKIEVGLFISEYQARKEYLTDRLRVLTMKEIELFKELQHELESLLPTMLKHYFPQITDLIMDEPFMKRYSEKILGKKAVFDSVPFTNKIWQ